MTGWWSSANGERGALDDISADAFTSWRETAHSDYGHNAKEKDVKAEPVAMCAPTKNQDLEGLRAFYLWCKKHVRMEDNPVAEVEKVDAGDDIQRARRAVSEEDFAKLLAAVPTAYQLFYPLAWPRACGRASCERWCGATFTSTRPPVHPLAGDCRRPAQGPWRCRRRDTVFSRVPRAREHRKWVEAAGIPCADAKGRHFDIHALRHEYGTLLSKAGVTLRVAMEHMRHTDMRLTMKVYTDPRIFDLSAAVEKLPPLAPHAPQTQSQAATGTGSSAPLPDARGHGGQ